MDRERCDDIPVLVSRISHFLSRVHNVRGRIEFGDESMLFGHFRINSLPKLVFMRVRLGRDCFDFRHRHEGEKPEEEKEEHGKYPERSNVSENIDNRG